MTKRPSICILLKQDRILAALVLARKSESHDDPSSRHVRAGALERAGGSLALLAPPGARQLSECLACQIPNASSRAWRMSKCPRMTSS